MNLYRHQVLAGWIARTPNWLGVNALSVVRVVVALRNWLQHDEGCGYEWLGITTFCLGRNRSFVTMLQCEAKNTEKSWSVKWRLRAE